MRRVQPCRPALPLCDFAPLRDSKEISHEDTKGRGTDRQGAASSCLRVSKKSRLHVRRRPRVRRSPDGPSPHPNPSPPGRGFRPHLDIYNHIGYTPQPSGRAQCMAPAGPSGRRCGPGRGFSVAAVRAALFTPGDAGKGYPFPAGPAARARAAGLSVSLQGRTGSSAAFRSFAKQGTPAPPHRKSAPAPARSLTRSACPFPPASARIRQRGFCRALFPRAKAQWAQRCSAGPQARLSLRTIAPSGMKCDFAAGAGSLRPLRLCARQNGPSTSSGRTESGSRPERSPYRIYRERSLSCASPARRVVT